MGRGGGTTSSSRSNSVSLCISTSREPPTARSAGARLVNAGSGEVKAGGSGQARVRHARRDSLVHEVVEALCKELGEDVDGVMLWKVAESTGRAGSNPGWERMGMTGTVKEAGLCDGAELVLQLPPKHDMKEAKRVDALVARRVYRPLSVIIVNSDSPGATRFETSFDKDWPVEYAVEEAFRVSKSIGSPSSCQLVSFQFGFRDTVFSDTSARVEELPLRDGAVLLLEVQAPAAATSAQSAPTFLQSGFVSSAPLPPSYGIDPVLPVSLYGETGADSELRSTGGTADLTSTILAGLEASYESSSSNYTSKLMASMTFGGDGSVAPPSFVRVSRRIAAVPLKLGTLLGAAKRLLLENCLDTFMAAESLTADNAWHCPKCQVKRSAVKTLSISRLPEVLVLQLNRFTFRDGFRDKLCPMVDFPLRGLCMSPSMKGCDALAAATNTYDLYAVCNHKGTAGGGHYTAYVQDKDSTWLHFDDRSVAEVPEAKVVSPDAYILFYRRRSGSSAETHDEGIDSSAKDAFWSCAACTFVNERADAPVCEVCGTARPVGDGAPAATANLWRTDDDRATASSSHGVTVSRAGLHNLGNTCYLNAALQCLRATPAMHDFLVYKSPMLIVEAAQRAASKRRDGTSRNSPGSTSKGGIVGSLSTLFGALNLGEATRSQVEAVKSGIDSVASMFAGHEQHDAQELLMYLLPALHDEANVAEGGECKSSHAEDATPAELADEVWTTFLKQNDSVVSRCLTGQLQSQLSCESCGHVSRRYDPFMVLGVPLPMGMATPI